MNEYAGFKMEHATSTACFILPRRKAQWNLRVLHMQVLGVIPDRDRHHVIDEAAIAKLAERARAQSALNKSDVTAYWRRLCVWQLLDDKASNSSQFLTSRWNAHI